MVPFHGKVDQRFLTNKQKRLLEKRKQGKVTGPAKSGTATLKTMSELAKDKKKKMQRLLKQDPEMRKKHAKALKDAYWERKAQKIKEQEAKPRSFKIAVGGVKPSVAKKQRNGRKPIYI